MLFFFSADHGHKLHPQPQPGPIRFSLFLSHPLSGRGSRYIPSGWIQPNIAMRYCTYFHAIVSNDPWHTGSLREDHLAWQCDSQRSSGTKRALDGMVQTWPIQSHLFRKHSLPIWHREYYFASWCQATRHLHKSLAPLALAFHSSHFSPSQ